MIKTTLKSIMLASMFFVFMSLGANYTHAGFGISPSDIINENLKPGSHYEKTITLNRVNSDEALKINVIPELDEMSDWFKFEPSNEFIMEKGESKKILNVVIDVPDGVDLKNYSGNIKVTASSIEQGDQGGVSVVKGAKIMVQLITTDINISDLLVRKVDIEYGEYGDPLELNLLIENVGNVEAAPTKIELDVYDLARNPVDKYEVNDISTILPGVTDEITVLFDHSLDSGEYFGTVSIYMDENLLRQEDLYFRYGDLQDSESESTSETSGELIINDGVDMKSFDGMNIILIVITLSILALIIYLLKKKNNTNLMQVLWYLILLAIGIIVIIGIRNNIEVQENNVEPIQFEDSLEIESGEQDPKTEEEESDNMEESEYEEEVKGIQVNDVNPKSYQYEGRYPVFKEANRDSEIMYFANDGDSFNLLEDNGDWLLIVDGNGREGWIEKRSLKSN